MRGPLCVNRWTKVKGGDYYQFHSIVLGYNSYRVFALIKENLEIPIFIHLVNTSETLCNPIFQRVISSHF